SGGSEFLLLPDLTGPFPKGGGVLVPTTTRTRQVEGGTRPHEGLHGTLGGAPPPSRVGEIRPVVDVGLGGVCRPRSGTVGTIPGPHVGDDGGRHDQGLLRLPTIGTGQQDVEVVLGFGGRLLCALLGHHAHIAPPPTIGRYPLHTGDLGQFVLA